MEREYLLHPQESLHKHTLHGREGSRGGGGSRGVALPSSDMHTAINLEL